MARSPMTPHGVLMHGGQINFGQPSPDGKMVDAWHLDSVPYVLIVAFSDPDEYDGGELQIARYPDMQECLTRLKDKTVPEGAMVTEAIKMPAAGYGILLQGSQIIHAVNPVRKGTRISMVNSYASRD